jgi:hypothetical protein
LLCPYCSFNRFPYREDAAHAYFRALREEMRMVADRGYRFSAMYVGGGTPTVRVDELVATIDLARQLFGVDRGVDRDEPEPPPRRASSGRSRGASSGSPWASRASTTASSGR